MRDRPSAWSATLAAGAILWIACDAHSPGEESCGDGVCDAWESVERCPQDCVPGGPVCGNGYCESGETLESCPDDCVGAPPSACGNGVCEAGETVETCPNDCADVPFLQGGCTPEDQRDICVLDDDADAAFTGPGGGLVGTSLAIVGDVDGDGLDDVLIGNPRSDQGGEKAGVAYLIYGRPQGLQDITLLTEADAVFQGSRRYGVLGFRVSGAGDVDGDGYADLLIGEPNNYAEADGDGCVYLLPGGPERYHGTIPLSEDAWPAGARLCDQAVDGWAGWSLGAAGDVDGDGLDDFLVGAPFYGSKASPIKGAAYLVYGGFAWGAETLSLAAVAVTLVNDREASLLGFAVDGAGDLDGDGLGDFVIGSPGDGSGDAGEALVFYGRTDRFGSPLSPADADARLDGGDTPRPTLGLDVAGLGDLDGDGFDELLVGAPWDGWDVGFLFYGRPDRLGGHLDVGAADVVLTGSITSGDGPGMVRAGDVNGDGFAELLVHGNDTSSYGASLDAVFLFLGGPVRLQGPLPLGAANAVFITDPGTSDDCQGFAGSAVGGGGDVNGDGLDDLLIGASGFCHGGDHSGYVYLVLGAAQP